MNRLTYTKIADDSIIINLFNGYSVIAMKKFYRETNKYEVTFYIKENTVDILDLISSQENIEFAANYKTINSAILKHVATLLSDGSLDYYINRYEYMLECFDKGNALFEKELGSQSH